LYIERWLFLVLSQSKFGSMKAVEVRLLKEYDNSFLVYHEVNPFSRWHYHPDIELVLIIKGEGKRMIGDHIDRFENGDLVFMGPNLPHEWLCDDEYYYNKSGFQGEGIVIQFLDNFLGDGFFDIPENKKLKKMMAEAERGCLIQGQTKEMISAIMKKMITQNSSEQLYSLFTIFQLLSNSTEHSLLSSPNFLQSFKVDGYDPMKKVVQYIMQNFQDPINIKNLLDIANMSNTSFSILFKKTHNMTFKEYLVKVRVGYACRLLDDDAKSISQISFEAGFENLSNFNRLFKKIKGCTPSEFKYNIKKSETLKAYYLQND
jgi:AraC-like DNA-binding protein